MKDKKRASAEDLFEKYSSSIIIESIDHNEGKEQALGLDYAPAIITIIIPGSMIEEYKKLATTKGKSEYPAANKFVKETGILDKIKKSNIKIINKNWNKLGDILDCFRNGFYSASFQPLESKDVRLEIEEIPTGEASAA